jgi:hypothetical protein
VIERRIEDMNEIVWLVSKGIQKIEMKMLMLSPHIGEQQSN